MDSTGRVRMGRTTEPVNQRGTKFGFVPLFFIFLD